VALLVEAAMAEEVVAVVAEVEMARGGIVVFLAEGMLVAWKLCAVHRHKAAEPAVDGVVAAVAVVVHN
jgi:hypothetical protein